ncbi:DUF7365 family protein [Macrococcus equipercicus]|uniref:DUF7365 domain-containing protein n=1 Tax=Macrococcus equipercicus TaxID=69967 RepID=A0A9Q9F0W8_9STAP|nr:hypothetical protein [Macrococcus equipercicus]UTH13287.1 hypothetical protein KFV11_08430 [Macrococcus equipercicus]
MEDVVLNWIIKVAVPVAGVALVLFSMFKANEKRLSTMETDLVYMKKKDDELSARLQNVENNYAILIRVEEQLKTLFKQNEEIKQEVKTIKNEERGPY